MKMEKKEKKGGKEGEGEGGARDEMGARDF